jgi:hypothetical protein
VPIVFIHGVNTRIDEAYHHQRRKRGDFIDKFLKPVLPKPYSTMEVLNPYWGDDGAQTGSSVLVPSQTGGSAEAFGSRGAAGPEDRESCEEMIDSLLGALGGLDETVTDANADSFELVAKGLWDLRHDEELKRQVDDTRTREAALNIISEALHERFASPGGGERAQGVESYGIRAGVARVGSALGGLFNHPYVKRPISTGLGSRRAGLHKRFALFIADVFVYLKERGNSNDPGSIVAKVLDAFKKDEPTLVVTHSMGGNIFYDVISHFAPKTNVTAWMSVGGQVGFFEYHRLFLKSGKERFTGQKVAKPIAGPWLNVYDPIDPFAFLAGPVFDGVEDYEFVTGSNIKNAHSDYFIKEEFYNRAGVRLGALLGEKPK